MNCQSRYGYAIILMVLLLSLVESTYCVEVNKLPIELDELQNSWEDEFMRYNAQNIEDLFPKFYITLEATFVGNLPQFDSSPLDDEKLTPNQERALDMIALTLFSSKPFSAEVKTDEKTGKTNYIYHFVHDIFYYVDHDTAHIIIPYYKFDLRARPRLIIDLDMTLSKGLNIPSEGIKELSTEQQLWLENIISSLELLPVEMNTSEEKGTTVYYFSSNRTLEGTLFVYYKFNINTRQGSRFHFDIDRTASIYLGIPSEGIKQLNQEQENKLKALGTFFGLELLPVETKINKKTGINANIHRFKGNTVKLEKDNKITLYYKFIPSEKQGNRFDIDLDKTAEVYLETVKTLPETEPNNQKQ